MKTAIIAIGDELTTGQVTDENSAWISDQLLSIGVHTTLHLTVGDEMDDIIDAFRLSGERADQVIVTGGLGPTEDDLTRDAFCKFVGTGTVLNEQSLDRIKALFKAIGREMSENNVKQAHIPEGADLIPNPTGTAPGFRMKKENSTYHFLPGVPRECKIMMEQTVIPFLTAMGSGMTWKTVMFRTFGMTESQLDQELQGLPLPEGVRLGYRAIFPEIHLKLSGFAESKKEAEEMVGRAAKLLCERVGDVIYSDDMRSLEEVVLDLFRERGMKLCTAESCTGGLVAKRLTDVAGSSDVFERGFVTYSNHAKTELLGVPAELIEKHGAVSSETAKAMAGGALDNSKADLAVALTGIAGPGGGTADKPVGTVHIALADKDGVWERRFNFLRSDRTFVRELSAQAALEIVRRRVLGLAEFSR